MMVSLPSVGGRTLRRGTKHPRPLPAETGGMENHGTPRTLVIEPAILYFGTPVALVTTRNPDGSANITPISSAWALADRVVIGLTQGSQGLHNLLRERECVLNLAGSAQHEAVERLAPTRGRQPLPPWKSAMGYRSEPDKFALAGWRAVPSQRVAPPRIAECPLQLEARLNHALARPIEAWRDGAGGYTVLELEVLRVHAHADIVVPGTSHIDPRNYHPLLYVFRHYVAAGPRLGRTFKAEV
jgi:flavin reductase (DIM6/NTAB) family NADH-FMN oxidoreductase RutF